MIISNDTVLAPKDGDNLSLTVEENASVTIVEEGTGTFTVTIVGKPNATIRYFSTSIATHTTRIAIMDDDATIDWVDLAYGGGVSSVTSRLEGKGSHAEFQSVFLGRNEEVYNIKSCMIHTGDKSTSNMKTRSVMLDKSSGNYEGLIRIDPNAAGCDAYQKEDTLLLSPDATMHATPNLEISNEDVRCSHGVSLSRIDDEKLFYITSRGLKKAEATNLIIHGFFDEILDRMGDRAARAKALLYTQLEVVS